MPIKFTSGADYYFIKDGKINSFIIHSGLSPQSAEILSKVFTVYQTWNEANLALQEYNKIFTTFKDVK